MAGRGIVYYEITSGNNTEQIGFFYDEVLITLLTRSGSKGKTITELRRDSGISDATIRSIVKQFEKMGRIIRKTEKSEKNLNRYIYTIRKLEHLIQ